MKIERFEDIEAWQIARRLTLRVYEVTNKGTFARDFGLRDQIRDASGSVMHNIAEGFDSGTNPEFVRFLQYAKRSCTEVQSELHVARDQGYICETEFNELYEQARLARSKIGAFINYLTNNKKP
jgi:four helix bundle protein